MNYFSNKKGFFSPTSRFAHVVIQIRKIFQLSPVTLSFSFQDIPYFPIYLQTNINSPVPSGDWVKGKKETET